MISRVHFNKVADALKARKPNGAHVVDSHHNEFLARVTQWELDVHAVASVLATFNPRFNMSRFLQACGLDIGNSNAA